MPKTAKQSGLIGRPQLSTEVESHIREQILTGQYPAGYRVRAEILAEELGVSPTPVREALQALRGQGFLSLEPRKGFRVLTLSRTDIADIFLAQAFLAGELAGRAALNLTADHLAALERIDQKIDEYAAKGDSARVQDLHDEFHRIINRSSESSKLKLLLTTTLLYVPSRFFVTTHRYPPAAGRKRVLDALRTRDSKKASEAMMDHIKHTGELLQQFLDEQSAQVAG
ncbi:GntR family transcriptional regulator [Rhodococcus sp. NPDC127530]|uniref:GntR family transcriptional regulator n=1 Tax=unclassified Rhodococcus (in: high G+C Gram-positive bacteria) TaxID=192944 RepID=UPI00362C7815